MPWVKNKLCFDSDDFDFICACVGNLGGYKRIIWYNLSCPLQTYCHLSTNNKLSVIFLRPTAQSIMAVVGERMSWTSVWSLNEHLHRPMMSYVPLKTTNYFKNLDSRTKTHNQCTWWRGDRKSQTGRGHWVTDKKWHLLTIAANFELSQFWVFDIMCFVLFVK